MKSGKFFIFVKKVLARVTVNLKEVQGVILIYVKGRNEVVLGNPIAKGILQKFI